MNASGRPARELLKAAAFPGLVRYPDAAALAAACGIIRVHAQLAGRVLEICAKPGSVVRPGDALIKMEAMKMISSVVAACAGKVGQVPVESGQSVVPGVLLAEIIPA